MSDVLHDAHVREWEAHVKRAEAAWRALFLAHGAAHHTYGVLAYAREATAGRTVQQMLRDIANNGPQTLTLAELAFLNQLLLRSPMAATCARNCASLS
jgi:hypothetical protein